MMLMASSLGGRCWMPNDPDCPGSRYTSEFPGVKYGIYVPFGPPEKMAVWAEKMAGWNECMTQFKET